MDQQRIAVITGATAGIGLATAQALALRGYLVVLVGRSPERCEAAVQRICQVTPQAQARSFCAELSSQRQVRELGAQLRASLDRVDVLVLCAGTVSSHHLTTEDGIEMQFAVNHLSGFLLTHELLALLRRAGGRVVAVSSNSHRHTKLTFPDVQHRRRYSLLGAYKRTKLCNVLFAAEVNRRLPGVRAFAADPGLVRTDIGLKGTFGLERLVWQLRMASGVEASVPGEAIAWLAAEEGPLHTQSVYWYDKKPAAPSPYGLQLDVADQLWQASERLCGIAPGSWGTSAEGN